VILTTRVIDFQGAAGADPAFKITVNPSPPKTGDQLTIDVLSAHTWIVQSLYGGLGAKRTLPAQQHQQRIDLSGATGLPTDAPVASLTSAITATPLVDVDARTIIKPAGDATALDLLKTVDGRLTIDRADLYGSIMVEYQGFPSQQWPHDAFKDAGRYVLFADAADIGKKELVVIDVSSGTPDDTSQPSIVVVQAKDFCTDLPIESATVYVNDVLIGQTDINGKVQVGLMNPGSHSVRIAASGYIATEVDDLANDSFTI